MISWIEMRRCLRRKTWSVQIDVEGFTSPNNIENWSIAMSCLREKPPSRSGLLDLGLRTACSFRRPKRLHFMISHFITRRRLLLSHPECLFRPLPSLSLLDHTRFELSLATVSLLQSIPCKLQECTYELPITTDVPPSRPLNLSTCWERHFNSKPATSAKPF